MNERSWNVMRWSAVLAFSSVIVGCGAVGPMGSTVVVEPAREPGVVAIDTRLCIAHARAIAIKDMCLKVGVQIQNEPGWMTADRAREFESLSNRYRSEAVEPLTQWWLGRSVLTGGGRGVLIRENGTWRVEDVVSERHFYALFEADMGRKLDSIRKDEERLYELVFPRGVVTREVE